MKRFVITGSGRSGTGYVAAVLRACGVACGHESVFTAPVAMGEQLIDWRDLDGDASWLALPHLPYLDVTTVLVVRDPLRVVESYVGLGAFRDGIDQYYARVIRRFTPLVYAESTEWDRALAHWCLWNTTAALHATAIERLESLRYEWLLDVLGVTPPADAAGLVAAVPLDTNVKGDDKVGEWRASWDQIRPPLARWAQTLAADFGY